MEKKGKICQRIQDYPMKKMALLALVLFLVSLIPLLALGSYNVMCIDDYDYGKQVYHTWVSTHSFREAVMTAVRQTGDFYRNWQGTYVSCFLMAMCPMNFCYTSAFIVPYLMIGLFSVSAYLAGRQVLVRWLGADRYSAAFVMFLLLFVYYQVIEAPYEGIYWYNGSTHYIFMQSMFFFVLTLLSSAIWSERKGAVIAYGILASLGAVVVGGGNLVTGLQAEIVMVMLLIYAFFRKRSRILALLIPFLTGSLSFLINIAAPGNMVRATIDTDVGYHPVVAIVLSFYYLAAFAIRWTNVMVIFLWLLVLPVLWRTVKRSECKFEHPVWVTIGTVCLVAAMFTPTLYAVGMVGLSRVDNIIQMAYYLGSFSVTAYWLGFLSHRQDCSQIETMGIGDAFGLFLEKGKNLITIVFFVLISALLLFTADKNTYTSVSALRSLYNGDAAVFYEEAMERHEIYLDETQDDIVLKPYSARPALFDFQDLSPDPGNWINLAVTDYFGKSRVRLAEE